MNMLHSIKVAYFRPWNRL